MNDIDLLRSWSVGEPADTVVRADARAAWRELTTGSAAVRPTAARRLVTRVLMASVITLVLVVGTVLALRRGVDSTIDRTRRVTVGNGALRERAAGPMNVLVVGSDSRQFVSDAQEADAFGTPQNEGGARSDAMILVRVTDAGVRAVWLPRDLLVGSPGARRQLDSYLDEGPAALIDAVRTYFGVPIDHYVEADFRQFVEAVDRAGGVRMEVPAPVRDVWTGLDVPAPGCTTFDGSRALAWVRSRHLQAFVGGRWVDASPRGDLDRIARQQELLRAAATQLRARVGTDPVRAVDVVREVVASMTVDAAMTRDQIKELARRLVTDDPATWTTATLPVAPAPEEVGRLVPAGPTGEAIFSPPPTAAQPTAVPQLAGLGASC